LTFSLTKEGIINISSQAFLYLRDNIRLVLFFLS
jgi:hypothetical protein